MEGATRARREAERRAAAPVEFVAHLAYAVGAVAAARRACGIGRASPNGFTARRPLTLTPHWAAAPQPATTDGGFHWFAHAWSGQTPISCLPLAPRRCHHTHCRMSRLARRLDPGLLISFRLGADAPVVPLRIGRKSRCHGRRSCGSAGPATAMRNGVHLRRGEKLRTPFASLNRSIRRKTFGFCAISG